MEDTKIEKLDMNKKPKEEIAIFGLGVLFNKIDDLITKQDRTNFLLSMIEKKIEATMTTEQLAKLKRKV